MTRTVSGLLNVSVVPDSCLPCDGVAGAGSGAAGYMYTIPPLAAVKLASAITRVRFSRSVFHDRIDIAFFSMIF